MATFYATYPPVSLTAGPINIVKNGVTTPVNLDTSTPANIVPVPVYEVDATGASAPWSLEATQLLVKTAVQSVNTKTPTVGQKAMAASSPVVISSDQSAVPVSGTFWQATQPVSAASLPLPAGAATETTLAGASAKLPATLGQKTSAASMAVVIASDQSTVPVSAASLPLPTGAATSALQTTGNTSVASIDTKTPALGQALAAASVPVVLTAAQITTLTPLATVALGAGAATIGSLAANQSVNMAQVGGNTISTGAGPSGTGVQRQTISNAATPTTANVASSATNVTLLASSATRLGAAFYNDSSSVLYLKFGATASTTSFTVLIGANGYYEIPGPHIYSGIVDGIWASATGACRVTSW